MVFLICHPYLRLELTNSGPHRLLVLSLETPCMPHILAQIALRKQHFYIVAAVGFRRRPKATKGQSCSLTSSLDCEHWEHQYQAKHAGNVPCQLPCE